MYKKKNETYIQKFTSLFIDNDRFLIRMNSDAVIFLFCFFF